MGTQTHRSDHRRSAERFLDTLLDERAPDFAPPNTARWAEAFLAAFRRFRDAQRGKEAQRAAVRLGRRAAADPHRFFWEFWQNADDAQATELTLEVDYDQLTIRNNGRPLSPPDVFSLLMVGESTKEGRDDQIGQFGVGSLALMRCSDEPTYRSGHYAFTLQRSYTYPGAAPFPRENYLAGLEVIAPLRNDVEPDTLYRALAGMVDGEALLYMSHLQRVTVRRVGGETRTAEAEVRRAGAGAQVTIGERTWLRYQQVVPAPANMRRDDGSEPPNPVRVTLARDASGSASGSMVHAFFPTQVRHHYPWRFSAPFDVTTGREGLIESPYNRWLLREIGRLMVQVAVDASLGKPATPWDLVPWAPEEPDLLNEVWQGALEEMRCMAWLPAGRRLIRAGDAAFPQSAEVLLLLRPSDVAAAAGSARRWIEGVPRPEARRALQEAGAFYVCCHTLSATLAAGPRGRQRGPEWYLRALATTIDIAKEHGSDEVRARLIEGRSLLNRRGQPFSLSEAGRAGRVICNTRSEVLSSQLGTLFTDDLITLLHQVYRFPDRRTENPADLLRRRVDEWLRDKDSPSTFAYESRLDAQSFIRHFVVDRSLAASDGEVADHLLEFVRDHLEAYVTEQGPQRRRQTLAQLGHALQVKAHQLTTERKRVTSYRPVSEVHLPARFFGGSAAWPQAARGVPGLWWADSAYRSRLARKDSSQGAARFLRDLGAAVGPRIEAVNANAWHGIHNFYRVARSDYARFPNFPHHKVNFEQYSDYGLANEADSPDLHAWWRHVSQLPDSDRALRGKALLQVFEDNWDSYKTTAFARAHGYRANGSFVLEEKVFALWLWRLRTWQWVAMDSGNFATTTATYCRTPTTVALLKRDEEPVCAWEVRDVEVARALGFLVDVPGAVVLRYLRDASKREAQLPLQTASAYYGHLATQTRTLPDLISAFDEALVYSPGSHRRWWRPAECLRADQRGILEDLCGYVHFYPAAEDLWRHLGVLETADLDFLAAFWRRMAVSLTPGHGDLRKVLQPSYALAERLLVDSTPTMATVPVLAHGEWHPSSEVFATASDELATQLVQDGLWRWDGEAPDLLPRFLGWIGLFDVDRTACFSLLSGNVQVEPTLEQRVHRGVMAFAAEIRAIQPALWTALSGRLREIVHGRVQVVDPLRLHVVISHSGLGEREYDVSTPAYYRGGNVFLSRLTKPSDSAVATALLAGVALASEARWAAIKALQLHLSDEAAGTLSFPPALWEDGAPGPEDLQASVAEAARETHVEQSADLPSQSAPPTSRPSTVSPPYPVDRYEVESDEGGDEPAAVRGGLEPRRSMELRRPGAGGGGSGPGPGYDHHSRRSTEQRAVDLYRVYVLDPAGITIRDQRLRPRVGADLVGDDGVFRELKAHSGDAPTEISLTEHEYQRAANQGKQYELVIVEHVWDEPIVTVISDPLTQLKYAPSGGVVVRDWSQLTSKRVVRLGKPSA